jgi:hypothetical protein
MIKQLPEEYEVVDMRYFRKNFSCPTTESFDELRGAVMALIDQTNAQYEVIQRIIGRQHRHLADDHKKPKSTNIELRQKIAVLEQNNNALQQKCEEYLGKITEAKQALELFCSEDVRYHPSSKINATHARKALDQINRWKY